MAKILISPSKYVQGSGEMKNIGKYAAAAGKKALVLISQGGYKRIGKMIEDSFAENNCELVFDYFNGECSTNEIDRLAVILQLVLAAARFLIQRKLLRIMPEHRCSSVRRSRPQMLLAVLCL